MVQKVTGFKTQDGKVFDTEALAVAHEKTLLLGTAVSAALLSLGFKNPEDASIICNGEGFGSLSAFLLENSEVIVDALTPPKKERKPRTPKEPVANTAPAVADKPAPVAEATEKVELEATGPAVSAEDELAELLGGEVQV